MRKVNILIYCRTRIRNRKRKQHILGITLQPLNRKKEENILQLNFISCFFAVLIFFFLPLTKPLLSGHRKLLSRPEAESICKFLYMVYSGLLRSFPTEKHDKCQKAKTITRKYLSEM